MNFLTIATFVGCFYLYKWTRKKSGHHHELAMFDVLDRVFRWVIVVAAIWIVVGLAFHAIELKGSWEKLSANTGVSAPPP